MLTLIVPPEIGTSHIYGADGKIYQSRVSDDGRVVIDVPAAVLHSLLADRQFGAIWNRTNSEALHVLGSMN